jgi:hypothetical protein
MRKAMMGVGGLGLLTLAMNGFAGNPVAPMVTEVAPQPTVIVEIVRPFNSAPKTSGPIDLDVVLKNTGAVAMNAITVKFGYGTESNEQVVSVPAHGARVLQVHDPIGLTSICAPRNYTIDLKGPGAVTATRHAHVTPACSFKSALVDEWNLKTPDRVLDAEKGNIYLTNAVLETAPTCSAGAKLKAQVANQTKLASASILVQAHNGTTVKAQTSAAFPIAAGEYKNVVLTPVGPAGPPLDSLNLDIVDWTHGFGSKLVSHSIEITTTKTCTTAVSLDPG